MPPTENFGGAELVDRKNRRSAENIRKFVGSGERFPRTLSRVSHIKSIEISSSVTGEDSRYSEDVHEWNFKQSGITPFKRLVVGYKFAEGQQ